MILSESFRTRNNQTNPDFLSEGASFEQRSFLLDSLIRAKKFINKRSISCQKEKDTRDQAFHYLYVN